MSAKELADAAVDGNPVAVQAFRHGAEALAATIASVAAVCDLDRVVVGGEWPTRARYSSTRCVRRWPSTPAWPTSAACGCCPPSSATMPVDRGGDTRGIVSRVGEPFTGSRASTSGGDADGWRCWPRAIRAPFWLISDATLLWWPVHRRPSVTENRLKAREHPGGPRRRTRPLRRHCRPCAPDRILRRGVRGFRGRCLLVKAVDGQRLSRQHTSGGRHGQG
ncbi:putative glucokinase [Mycobacterium xenopi 4042]|uniref:Putative glucokinase n=1 Tax=Mycobacterium xenopi 4042 TaxID=1299334 RepID=X7YJV2_MYCXE|nr:putative glucokinase [Mycobacterium xenopi 4042]